MTHRKAPGDRLLRRSEQFAAAVVVAVALGLLAVQLRRFFPYCNDDAFITFRYSRALAEGRGPFFNPGEHVEGYTNPVWMLLVSVWIKAFGASRAAIFAKSLGIGSAISCVLFAFALARGPALAGSAARAALVAGCTAAGMVAISPSFAVNAVSGLETALFSALLAAGALLSASGRERASACAFALAAVTRPEGAVIFGVHWLARLAAESAAGQVRPRLRSLLESGLTVTSVVGLHLLVRVHLYDGEWLPNTYYAKLGGFGRPDYWLEVYDGGLAPLFGASGLLLGAAGLALDRPALRRLFPPLVAGLAGAHLPLVTGADWMIGARLVIPYLPLLGPPLARGWASLLGRWCLPWWSPLLLVSCLPALWLAQRPLRASLERRVDAICRDVDACHAGLAVWLEGKARSGDALATTDIGLVGFAHPELVVIDVSGLTDRSIAKSKGRFLEKEYDPKLVLDRQPRWIVFSRGCGADGPLPAFEQSTEGRIAAAKSFARDYHFVRWFSQPAPACERRFALYERTGG